MVQYDGLAKIYDYLVSGVDYEGWKDYISRILANFNHRPRKAADLACGTANTTLPLAELGFKVYGIDLAPRMLEIAREKAGDNPYIFFLEQDMRELNLPEAVDLIVCYHDGLNYLTEPGDLEKTFKKVYENLNPKGLFIFDLNRVEKLSRAPGDVTFLDEDNLTLIWETNYLKENDVWEIKITGFLKKGELYEKFTEVHREKAFSEEKVKEYLSNTGFELLALYGSFTFNPPGEDCRRVFYVARRP